MTERAQAEHRSTGPGRHFQLSRLLAACIVAATAATGALLVTVLVAMPGRAPGPGPGGDGMPPPPPDLRPLAVVSMVTGLFVLSWVAALVVFCRDQILHRLGAAADGRTDALLSRLRAELATDRRAELELLEQRLAEYGERCETDGYLSGMRVATADHPREATVRPIRRPPTAR